LGFDRRYLCLEIAMRLIDSGQNVLARYALLAAACLLACVATTRSAEYYVATNGSDMNPGTPALPFASVARGQQAASAGDTVWIRGGDYVFSGITASVGVLFNKSGTNGNRINYWAYPGETPVFDFFNLTTQARIKGFSVTGDWLHFRGIELKGVQQIITNVNESWGIRIESGADNNVFERLNLHHNEGPGLFIADGGNNVVLNCDSHHNYDPDRGGENADGFGSHSNDNGNTFIGNRAWENSDDGFDFINSRGSVTLEGSWAWRNGYIPGTNTSAGNGAGVKGGGFGTDSATFPAPENVPTNVIRGNIAFDNRVQGFYANHHPGGNVWLNNTAFDNSRGFDLLADIQPTMWPADHFLRNNISFSNNTNLINATQSDIDDEFNTWNTGLAAASADFLNLSTAGVDGPRQADGSLPDLNFLKLVLSSHLVDAGTNVGLTFNGLAPDLGAFETALPGDYNQNSVVDAGDYLVWRDSFGQSGSALAADGDGNGSVGDEDYELWRTHFGQKAGPTGSSSIAATGLPGGNSYPVPEPSTIGWLFAPAAALCPSRRLHKR
jgi:parallel beta-helix repeat protein